MASEILVAKATAQVTVDGLEVRIVAGQTTVRAGHPILDGREDLFELLVPTFEVESDEECEVVEPPTSVPPGDSGSDDDNDAAYDPSAYNVDEVNGYLDKADGDEIARVLEVEREGKARVGILSGPHSDLSGLD